MKSGTILANGGLSARNASEMPWTLKAPCDMARCGLTY
jgi:hypothetical protein